MRRISTFCAKKSSNSRCCHNEYNLKYRVFKMKFGKRNYIKHFLCCASVLSALGLSAREAAAQTQEISLTDAIESAHQNSKADEQLEIKAQIAEAKLDEVKAKWWPQITADAKVLVWNDKSMLEVIDKDSIDGEKMMAEAVAAIDMSQLDPASQATAATLMGMVQPMLPALKPAGQSLMNSVMGAVPEELELRKQFTTILGVQLLMPLTPLFQVYQGQKLAELGQRDVELERKGEDLKVEYEVTDVYLKLVYAQLMIDVAQEALDTITQHVAKAEKYESVGLISHSDVLSAEVELVKAKQNVMEAKQGARLAGMKLTQVLGLPRGTELRASDMPQETYEVKLDSLTSYQEKALEQRSELERLSLTQELGERQETIALLDYVPKVALIARYEYSYGISMQPTNQAFIGLAANWTIFDGLEKYYAAKRAKLEASQNASRISEVQDLIALEVSQKYLNVETAVEKTQLTHQALVVAEENLRTISAQFAQGESVITDVLTAQTKRTAAHADDVKARIDVLAALAALKLSLGEEPGLSKDAIDIPAPTPVSPEADQ